MQNNDIEKRFQNLNQKMHSGHYPINLTSIFQLIFNFYFFLVQINLIYKTKSKSAFERHVKFLNIPPIINENFPIFLCFVSE